MERPQGDLQREAEITTEDSIAMVERKAWNNVTQLPVDNAIMSLISPAMVIACFIHNHFDQGHTMAGATGRVMQKNELLNFCRGTL